MPTTIATHTLNDSGGFKPVMPSSAPFRAEYTSTRTPKVLTEVLPYWPVASMSISLGVLYLALLTAYKLMPVLAWGAPIGGRDDSSIIVAAITAFASIFVAVWGKRAADANRERVAKTFSDLDSEGREAYERLAAELDKVKAVKQDLKDDLRRSQDQVKALQQSLSAAHAEAERLRRGQRGERD